VIDFEYIKEQERFNDFVPALFEEKEIGLDLEFDHNSFSYGINLCLIQISLFNKAVFLIDPISIKNIDPLFDFLGNPGILKIIHSASEDVRVINNLGARISGILDTEKIARLIGKEKFGLSDLLRDYFGIKLDKKLQRSNWNLRPVSPELLDYAAQDVFWLHDLKRDLMKEVFSLGLNSWVDPLMQDFEKEFHKEKKNEKRKIKGFVQLEANEKIYAESLLEVREKFAGKNNKPPFMILQNHLILELAKNPVQKYQQWTRIKGLSPWSKNRAFFDEFVSTYYKLLSEDGLSSNDRKKERGPKVPPYKFNRRMKLLEVFAERLKGVGGVEASRLVISKKKMNDISASGDYSVINNYFLENFGWTSREGMIEFKKAFE
jgi:ribonuclease D